MINRLRNTRLFGVSSLALAIVLIPACAGGYGDGSELSETVSDSALLGAPSNGEPVPSGHEDGVADDDGKQAVGRVDHAAAENDDAEEVGKDVAHELALYDDEDDDVLEAIPIEAEGEVAAAAAAAEGPVVDDASYVPRKQTAHKGYKIFHNGRVAFRATQILAIIPPVDSSVDINQLLDAASFLPDYVAPGLGGLHALTAAKRFVLTRKVRSKLAHLELRPGGAPDIIRHYVLGKKKAKQVKSAIRAAGSLAGTVVGATLTAGLGTPAAWVAASAVTGGGVVIYRVAKSLWKRHKGILGLNRRTASVALMTLAFDKNDPESLAVIRTLYSNGSDGEERIEQIRAEWDRLSKLRPTVPRRYLPPSRPDGDRVTLQLDRLIAEEDLPAASREPWRRDIPVVPDATVFGFLERNYPNWRKHGFGDRETMKPADWLTMLNATEAPDRDGILQEINFAFVFASLELRVINEIAMKMRSE